MGNDKINALIRDLKLGKEIRYSDLTLSRIAVDATNWLYSNYITVYGNSIDNKTLEINEIKLWKSWISNAFRFVSNFLNHKILPIMVFDGKNTNNNKSGTWEKRKQDKEKKRKNLEQTSKKNKEEYIRAKKQAHDGVPQPAYRIFPNFFKALGIPVIIVDGEAEAVCSILQVNGNVDYVWSPDSDNLAYGCTKLLRWDTFSKVIKLIELNDVLCQLKIPFSSFLDLYIITGCDYNTNPYRFGAKTALKIIKEYGKISKIPRKNRENIMKHEEEKDMKKFLNYDECIKVFSVSSLSEITSNEINILSPGKVHSSMSRYIGEEKLEEYRILLITLKEIIPEWFEESDAYVFDEDISYTNNFISKNADDILDDEEDIIDETLE